MPPGGRESRSTFVQHGAGWVGALAAVAGVVLTAIVTFGGGQRPEATIVPTGAAAIPSATGTAAPTPSTAATTTRPSTPAATPRSSMGPFGPVLPDVADGAGIVASIVAPDLPPGEAHELVLRQGGDLALEAPRTWEAGDIGGPWIRGVDEVIGSAAQFAPSGRRFEAIAGSGIFVGASTTLDEALDPLTEDVFEGYWRLCQAGGRGHYDDGVFAGNYEVYGPCSGGDIRVIAMLVRDEATNRTLNVAIHAETQADLAAAAAMIDSIRFEPVTHGITP